MKKLLILLFVSATLISCERSYILPTPKLPTVKKISFSQELQPLFNTDCTACHYNGGDFPDLTSGNSYNELLTGMPVYCSSYSSCIDTLNPASSLLYIKLFSSPVCGGIMPDGSSWSPVKIQKVLDWINQGALNN